MAVAPEAPVCGEYNRKKGLARQIYTIWRSRWPQTTIFWGCKRPTVSLAQGRSEAVFHETNAKRVSGRPQPCSQKVKNRCYHEHNSIHFKFPRGCVRENPDDGSDRERGHNFHSGKVEGLSTVGAHVALHQQPAGGATEQIHQENRDV